MRQLNLSFDDKDIKYLDKIKKIADEPWKQFILKAVKCYEEHCLE